MSLFIFHCVGCFARASTVICFSPHFKVLESGLQNGYQHAHSSVWHSKVWCKFSCYFQVGSPSKDSLGHWHFGSLFGWSHVRVIWLVCCTVPILINQYLFLFEVAVEVWTNNFYASHGNDMQTAAKVFILLECFPGFVFVFRTNCKLQCFYWDFMSWIMTN